MTPNQINKRMNVQTTKTDDTPPIFGPVLQQMFQDSVFCGITQPLVVIPRRCFAINHRCLWAETSAKNYHYKLRNIPEEGRFYLHGSASLISRRVNSLYDSIQRYTSFYPTKLLYAVLHKLIFKFNLIVWKWNIIFVSYRTEHNWSASFTPLQVNCCTSMSDPLAPKRCTISISATP